MLLIETLHRAFEILNIQEFNTELYYTATRQILLVMAPSTAFHCAIHASLQTLALCIIICFYHSYFTRVDLLLINRAQVPVYLYTLNTW